MLSVNMNATFLLYYVCVLYKTSKVQILSEIVVFSCSVKITLLENSQYLTECQTVNLPGTSHLTEQNLSFYLSRDVLELL